jgi:hypothetical protein
MEESTPELLPGSENKRPVLLTVLCILTFIGSGLNLFSSLVTALVFDVIMPVMLEVAKKFEVTGLESLEMITPGYLLINALLYAGSVTGAILMMRLNKKGFHIYTIAQILLIIFPMYYFSLPAPSMLEMLFAGLFILLYGNHLKLMK